MTEFAIFVAVKLKPGCLEQYLPLIEVDRASALRDEPGCRHFDILRPEEGGDVVHLYEVYDDEEAFKADSAEALALGRALGKARSLADHYPGRVIIGSDQVGFSSVTLIDLDIRHGFPESR